LNGLKDLVHGVCKALAKDALSIVNDVQTQLKRTAVVAVIGFAFGLNSCRASIISIGESYANGSVLALPLARVA